MMPKKPLLMESALTGKFYIVTRYQETPDGNIVSGVKHDVTETVRAIQAAAWGVGYKSGHSRAMRHMSDEPGVEPGKNPYKPDHALSKDEQEALARKWEYREPENG